MTASRSRRFRTLCLVPLLALAAAASAEQADHADLDHRVVRILALSVHPQVLQMHSSDAISWLNYSNQRARVSFDADVAKHLTCRSRGSFQLSGERLVSGDIQATQFASLCSLAPGEYSYAVELFPGTGGGSTSLAAKRFEGRIRVEE